MAKADKTVAFRPSVEVWELLQKEKSYSEVIEAALKRYYRLEGATDSLGKSSPPSEEAIETIVEEKLQSYQANFNQALARMWERLEAVEAAPDTAKDDADQETRSRLDELTERLEALENSHQSPPDATNTHSFPSEDFGGDKAAPVETGEELNATDLAKRLGLQDSANISRFRVDAEKLAAYTRDRDPDGIAWKWNGKKGSVARYSPIS